MMGEGSWKLSLLLFVLTQQLSTSVRGQGPNPFQCGVTGNYTSDSNYAVNLKSLLSSLSSDTGFYNASAGEGEDRVNALALCRGDQTLDQCRSCIPTTSDDVLQRCPNQKEAVMWHEFCMVRYSNETIYSTPALEPVHVMRNDTQLSNLNETVVLRTRLLDVVRTKADIGGPALKVGAGRADISDSQKLEALMQCTPDLSQGECDQCLLKAVNIVLPSCCNAMAGVRILMPSCSLRYELFPFYNDTRLTELQITPPSPPVLSPGTNNSNNNNNISRGNYNNAKVVIIIAVIVGVTLLFVACVVFFVRRRMKGRNESTPKGIVEEITVESLQHDFGTIKAATNDFADTNKLGKGGFGAVYKGELPNGREIAVKRLSTNSQQGHVEFKNEVKLLAKLQHKNLVTLLGFCTEEGEKLLIYEFVRNGSLDHFIFEERKRSCLDWEKRSIIIWGIASGLVYLHKDSRLKIIHRDLKPANVLLDGQLNPMIADFGLARLFGQDETHETTSKVAGTLGYMAPEYRMYGQFSIKSDVFSFGVIVLEIISGQRNNLQRSVENGKHLLSFAWENWKEGNLRNVIDPLLKYSPSSLNDILRCLQIGLLCVQERADDRPAMASVVLMLNGFATLAHPSEPAYHYFTTATATESSDFSSIPPSNNDVTVSELYPR